MALSEATPALYTSTVRTIGWDGDSPRGMLGGHVRALARARAASGVGVREFHISNKIRYEKIFSRLRGGLVSARETALNISASPIVKEIGELSFGLYTPEGDSVALSTGIIVHIHTMSDAIKYMIRQGYEDNPG